MSFVVWGVGAAVAGAAVSIGSKVYKGARAAGADYSDLEAGAAQVKQDQLNLLSGKETSAVSGANLGMDIAESQFATGQENIGMGTNMALRRTQAFGEQSYSKSNLATSGTIEQKMQIQTGDIMAKYKSDMNKLFDTKQFAGRQRDLNINEANLAYRSGELSAEAVYQDTLTGIESQPSTFMEGFTS